MVSETHSLREKEKGETSMKNRSFASFLASGAFLLLAAGATFLLPHPGTRQTSAKEEAAGSRVLAAAQGFIDLLSPDEKKRALFAFDDEERFNWHFIPRERKGIALKDLDDAKREKLAALLRASLSETGWKRVEDVRGLEDVLREIEGPEARFRRDPLLYYASVFGKPSAAERWGWRFEGHHLALNYTLEGEKILSATPHFFGANPARVKDGPKKGLRALAGVEDLARELMSSLDEGQRKRCLAQGAGEGGVPDDVPETEKPRYRGPLPEGVSGRDLDEKQRSVLLRLVAEYVGGLPEAVARDVVRDVSIESVHFAWAGGTAALEPHSYLVHGPTFVINYSNRQNGANHIHASFRELKKDFALAAE
jgi:hypothetical protein